MVIFQRACITNAKLEQGAGGTSLQQAEASTKPKKTGFKGTPNIHGRPPGPNKITRVLKDAILYAAAAVGEDGEGKNGLEGFLIREASKRDNRGFLMLLGKVLPMTVAFDKNRPLQVMTRVELVRPTGEATEPRDVTPPRQVTARVIENEPLPPAPAAPVRVKAPGRSGA